MTKKKLTPRSIWVHPKSHSVIQIIDQRYLPFRLVIEDLKNRHDVIRAIRDMHVRGAPLIGVTAAYGVYLALLEIKKIRNFEPWFEQALQKIAATRPTAVNLRWALDRQRQALCEEKNLTEKIKIAFETAQQIAAEDIEQCKRIGEYGFAVIQKISQAKKRGVVNILTHCNAGWLACVEWGTATAPIYLAHKKGIPLHVWVGETRPRSQGARLTAWELAGRRIPHTVIVDNAGGHLMQHGKVDLVLVGTDRTTRMGDVANKIGTYLKAVAARENKIPFYVAAPSSSIDWALRDGVSEIPIEERGADEVRYAEGWDGKRLKRVLLAPPSSTVSNFGFDVTPAKFITGIITERGICEASEEGLLRLFPERKNPSSVF